MGHLAAGMNARVGAACDGQLGRLRQPEQHVQGVLNDALDGAQARLAGPAVEVRPIVGKIEPEPDQAADVRRPARPLCVALLATVIIWAAGLLAYSVSSLPPPSSSWSVSSCSVSSCSVSSWSVPTWSACAWAVSTCSSSAS